MGSILYSNCSTITAGCYIYNDIYKTSPASNGYYSDGTNCYDVQWGNGYVQSVSTCAYAGDVYFTTGGESNFDGAGDYNWIGYASSTADSYAANAVGVTTTVTIYVTIYAEYGTYYGSSSIGAPYTCSTGFYADGVYPSQIVYTLTPTSVSPSSNGGQTYYASTGDIGTGYTCP